LANKKKNFDNKNGTLYTTAGYLVVTTTYMFSIKSSNYRLLLLFYLFLP